MGHCRGGRVRRDMRRDGLMRERSRFQVDREPSLTDWELKLSAAVELKRKEDKHASTKWVHSFRASTVTETRSQYLSPHLLQYSIVPATQFIVFDLMNITKPSSGLPLGLPLGYKKSNYGSRAYRNLSMELIFLCRFFVQTHSQCLDSSIQLRK